MKNFVTRPSSRGRFRALVSLHRGYVIGTPSFVWASQTAGLAGLSFPPHLIRQSFLPSLFRAPPA